MLKEPIENSYAWEFARGGDKPPLNVNMGITTYMGQPRIYVEITGFAHPAVEPQNYFGAESNNPAMKEPVEQIKQVVQQALDRSLESRDMAQHHVKHEPFKGEITDFTPGFDIARLCADFRPAQGEPLAQDKLKKNAEGMIEDIAAAIDHAIPSIDESIKKNAHLEPDMGSLTDVMASQKAYDEAQARARHALIKTKMQEEKGRG